MAERDRLGESWRGMVDGYVFTTGWGDRVYPDTMTTLMRKIINAYNKRPEAVPLPHARPAAKPR